mgnify:CR=1 FL=1
MDDHGRLLQFDAGGRDDFVPFREFRGDDAREFKRRIRDGLEALRDALFNDVRRAQLVRLHMRQR